MTTHTLEDDTRELLAVLPLLNRIVASEVRSELGEATTMPQFRVLDLLATEQLTLSALARQRRVSIQAMGELVQSLVERGLIVRSPNPNDRRQSLLQLTEQGQLHYSNAQQRLVQRLTPLLAMLSTAELAAVRVALRALHRVLLRTEEGSANVD